MLYTVLVFVTGVTVVGPHSVITSAVSADLVSAHVPLLYSNDEKELTTCM